MCGAKIPLYPTLYYFINKVRENTPKQEIMGQYCFGNILHNWHEFILVLDFIMPYIFTECKL